MKSIEWYERATRRVENITIYVCTFGLAVIIGLKIAPILPCILR